MFTTKRQSLPVDDRTAVHLLPYGRRRSRSDERSSAGVTLDCSKLISRVLTSTVMDANLTINVSITSRCEVSSKRLT